MARGTGHLGLSELVARASEHDEGAWRELVGRFERLVWKTVNAATSHHDIREDAAAATWLRLAENLHTVRDPERLGGWLVTTARHEVTAQFRRRRFTLDGHDLEQEPPPMQAGPAEQVEDDALRRALRAGFRRLPTTCQQLLSLLLLVDPPLSYADVELLMNRPRGSLGPTRARCLERLRNTPELRPFLDGMGAP